MTVSKQRVWAAEETNINKPKDTMTTETRDPPESCGSLPIHWLFDSIPQEILLKRPRSEWNQFILIVFTLTASLVWQRTSYDSPVHSDAAETVSSYFLEVVGTKMLRWDTAEHRSTGLWSHLSVCNPPAPASVMLNTHIQTHEELLLCDPPQNVF